MAIESSRPVFVGSPMKTEGSMILILVNYFLGNREAKLKKKKPLKYPYLSLILLSKMTFRLSLVLNRWFYSLHFIKRGVLVLTDSVLIPTFPKISCSPESLQKIMSALRVIKSWPWLRCTRDYPVFIIHSSMIEAHLYCSGSATLYGTFVCMFFGSPILIFSV